MDFLGSFHPLVLHLPIGFLVAAFLLEVVFRKQPNKQGQQAIRILLGLGAASAIVSATLGYFLAQKGGYQGSLLQVHQWSGFGVALCATLFFFLWPRFTGKAVVWVGWSVNLIVLTVAGHFGGSLTHGEDFLLKDAPPFIQTLLIDEETPLSMHPDSAQVFEDLIQAITEEKCLSCHNEHKKQGSLNLSTAATWQEGGKNGILYDAEDPTSSLLLRRIYLPLSHEDHMPPEGQKQLIPAEVALIRWWLDIGMPFDQKVGEVPKNTIVSDILNLSFEEVDPYEAIRVEPLSEQALARISASGITILPLTQRSSLLEARLAGFETITSEQWSLMREAREQIVRLELQFAAITDEDLQRLSTFEHLIHLSLQQTGITDAGIVHLKELPHLRHLNLYGTRITNESLDLFREMRQLRELYVWDTGITEKGLEALRKQRPDLELGMVQSIP